MREKTKIVDIGGVRYQVGRFLPDVGSFILMKMLGSAMREGAKAEGAGSEGAQKAAQEIRDNSTGEDKARLLATSVLFGNEDFQFHQFIQSKSLDVCARMEASGVHELPMPITNGAGKIAIPEVRDDISLVMRLTMEAIAFNLSDFFDQGGMGEMIGSPASNS